MAIGITEDDDALRQSTARFLARIAPVAETRAQLDELALGELPKLWAAVLEQGLHALHLPEELGGGGGRLVDLAVVVEETGRALLPGPFLPTVLASDLYARYAREEQRGAILPRFFAGATGATSLTSRTLRAEATSDGYEIFGTTEPILGVVDADLILLGARAADEQIWFLLDTEAHPDLHVQVLPGVDLTRSIGIITLDGFRVPMSDLVTDMSDRKVRALAAVMFAAESVGSVQWCLDSILSYVKDRKAFGQVVGSFQAVKHKCALVFIELEKMTASAWDGARSVDESPEQHLIAAASSAVSCLNPAMDAVLETLTLFGGIGFTWEHDIHLYWRRCIALSRLLGSQAEWTSELGRLAATQSRRFDVVVEEEPDFRSSIRATLAGISDLPTSQQRSRLADEGLVVPHYPKPYGLGASPTQQMIIAQEFQSAGMVQPNLIIGEWALPTIIAHGSEVQRERFVPPTVRGEIEWCQLFSEPGAGSDLASLSTRATRTPGGWRVNGQKVWTSRAHVADWGICLARTDPDVPKHQGISYFLIDMKSEGIDIRPLRQSTGDADFNEVFFADVFVPDDCLVGQENAGWTLARTTLGNERVQMGGMLGFGLQPLELLQRLGLSPSDPAIAEQLGAVIAERICLESMGLRALMRRMSGLQPGAEASVLKLATSWHQVRVAKAAMDWVGPMSATFADGPARDSVWRYLSTPSQLIGGGTSEIQLNVIAERVLGLPRR